MRRVDLVAENVDLAVRFGPLPETWRRARRLLAGRYRVFAAPEQAASLQGLDTEDAVAKAPCLVLDATHLRTRWPLLRRGRMSWAAVEPTLVCDDVEALVHLAASGLGVTMLPDFLVEAEVAEGRLVALGKPREGGAGGGLRDHRGEGFAARPAMRRASRRRGPIGIR